ncbi:DUF4268 domain-containing protein [Salinimicrobium sp. CDJ15-81-2]|nr:DUF4268 domain-containing protein [Salinimicrobium nanhaiense]
MYRINKEKNNIAKLEERLFSDLKIRERENLQEWIAKNPEMLGEELLIIQKEFDGFNDTQERLDLLAIDKDGGLVIIENKLDDSGRNVVWQALKYTSYCSTLTNSQIINIYQAYLDAHENGEDAKERLLEFLDRDEEELLLNKNDQRIIFVANKYRKEVTSTVLWLLNHEIQIQCFRAIPYSMGEEIFLQVEQIIPLPETKEFMIDAMEKEKEEKTKSKAVAETENRLVRFWTMLKKELQQNNFRYLDSVTPKPYFDIGFIRGAGRYNFCIGRKTNRIELYFPNDPENEIVEEFKKHQKEIEDRFGHELIFDGGENRKASKIKFEYPEPEFFKDFGEFQNEENWEKRTKWFASNMEKFYKAFQPFADRILKGRSYNG